MKRHWKILLVFLMFVGQTYMVYQQGKSFSELMEVERGRVERGLSAEGLPRQQVEVFSSLLAGVESDVRFYVGGVASLLAGANFLIFIMLLTERRRGRDDRGEA